MQEFGAVSNYLPGGLAGVHPFVVSTIVLFGVLVLNFGVYARYSISGRDRIFSAQVAAIGSRTVASLSGVPELGPVPGTRRTRQACTDPQGGQLERHSALRSSDVCTAAADLGRGLRRQPGA